MPRTFLVRKKSGTKPSWTDAESNFVSNVKIIDDAVFEDDHPTNGKSVQKEETIRSDSEKGKIKKVEH